MPGTRKRLSLTKTDLATPAGRELLALLTELSADGGITKEELERLRAWLEANREAPLQAREFLSSAVTAAAPDGEIDEVGLEAVQVAIERVLPPDLRSVAGLQRRQRRAAERQQKAAERASEREEKRLARERDRPLDRADFVVAGATKSAARRRSCRRLNLGDTVMLEREPGNPHDGNAIRVLSTGGAELGYVPRDDASRMAPLMDAGARADAAVKKLLTTRGEGALPVILAALYRADAQVPRAGMSAVSTSRTSAPAHGCGTSGCGVVLLLVLAVVTLSFCGAA